jgi:RNA polymerase sigma factor (sigma-70 family)
VVLSDRELLARATSEPGRIGEFYVRYEATVLAFFLRRVGDREAAAELAAETFAAVVWQCHRGVAVREPRAWLFSLAHGKLIDYLRRGRVADRARRRIGLERLDWSDEELERVEEVAARVPARELVDALAALPDEQRIAVLERVVGEQEYSRIAARRGTSEAVMRQRVHRGLARLRQLLKENA